MKKKNRKRLHKRPNNLITQLPRKQPKPSSKRLNLPNRL